MNKLAEERQKRLDTNESNEESIDAIMGKALAQVKESAVNVVNMFGKDADNAQIKSRVK